MPVVMRFLLCVLVALLVSSPAAAAVTITFHAHGGNQIRGGWLYFPHAYVTLTGTVDATGEQVDEAVGFTAKNPGPHLLLFSGQGIVDTPDALYMSEGRAYLTLVISDEVYEGVQALIAYWRSPEGSRYSLHRRNCISFVAEIGRLVGLRTAAENTLSPNGFLTATAALNPEMAVVPAVTADADEGAASRPAATLAVERQP